MISCQTCALPGPMPWPWPTMHFGAILPALWIGWRQALAALALNDMRNYAWLMMSIGRHLFFKNEVEEAMPWLERARTITINATCSAN